MDDFAEDFGEAAAGDFDTFDAEPDEGEGEAAPYDSDFESEDGEDEERDEEDEEEDVEGPGDDPVGDEPGAKRAARRAAKPQPAASQVVHIIPRDDCLTSDFITSNELAQVLACRSKQIAENADVFLPPGVEPVSRDPVMQAMQEFSAGLCPLTLQRVRSRGPGALYVEEFPVRELRLIQSLPVKDA